MSIAIENNKTPQIQTTDTLHVIQLVNPSEDSYPLAHSNHGPRHSLVYLRIVRAHHE